MGDSIFDCVKKFPEFDIITSSTIKETNQIYRGQCGTFIENYLSVYNDDNQKFLKFCANSGYHVTDKKDNLENELYPFCVYMIYWIYLEVLSKNKGKYSGLVSDFFGSVPNLEACKKYVDKIDQGVYEKLKTLYDLYEDFIKFKNESLLTDSGTYVNGRTCVELYNKHVEECNKNYKNGFCANLIDFKKLYEKHMTTLTNYGSMPRYLPSIGSNIATSVSIPVVAMSLISFVSFISYKYTTFGSWIHTKLIGGKKGMKNLHKEAEILQYTSEYQENPYRVSYQPSRYS